MDINEGYLSTKLLSVIPVIRCHMNYHHTLISWLYKMLAALLLCPIKYCAAQGRWKRRAR